ncbi:MAG: glycine cleavage system protein [Bacteroidetes bacterium]|jgi:glycine cleavage system H protein|nr:glycine cleavage system protein [Bacteroidota bacterium]
MNVPENLYYTAEHEWIRIEGETAFVGITDYAQSELGEIVFVDITSLGETLKAGDTFGSIEAVKTVSDLFLPVDASVVEFNEELNDHPEWINDDPYGKGWIIKIAVTDASQTAHLLSAEKYQALIG